MAQLDGRVIIVTGAAQGLGRAMTLGLLGRGGRVVGADVGDMSDLKAAAAAAGAADRLHTVKGDVTDPAQTQAIVAAGLSAFGSIDGLINNAGLGMNGITSKVISDPKPFHQVSPEQYAAVIRVNVDGPFMMTWAAVQPMLRQGRGKIVNVLTGRPTMTARCFSPYGPSKAAMEAATAIWAQDLAGTGITVNGLAPGGAADTSMIPEGDVDRSTLLRPEVMVAPSCWLMSAESDGVTGRRFIGAEWKDGLSSAEIVATLAREAGWSKTL